MKKAILVTSLITACFSASPYAQADANTEESVGFFSGAAVGGALGGPVGFILGSAVGALIGNEFEANDTHQQLLADEKARTQVLTETLTETQTDLAQQRHQMQTGEWLADGLQLEVSFATNSAELSTADQQNILAITEILRQFPALKLKLDGFADPRGKAADNLELSQKRVEAVLAAIESQGIDSDRLLATAHGEQQLLTNKPMTKVDAFAMARRVSLNFVKPRETQVAQN